MREYVRETVDVPVAGAYDVIIVGGGPAGVAAALAAARRGVHTLLVESYGFLGGMWTMGMVCPLFDHENKGGICRELVDDINHLGYGVQNGPDIWNFDTEAMKRLLDRKMEAAGADVLLHTHFAAPLMEDGRAAGVFVENKGGRSVYRAKLVIDCTGDGDVAFRAGAPCEVGRPGDGVTQPMTLMFRMSNIDYVQDYYSLRHYEGNELIAKLDRALGRAGVRDYPFNYRRPCVLQMPGSHTALCQTTHIRGRLSIDPADLSAAEIEGRKLAEEFFTLLKTYLPEFKDAQLDATGPHIGIRESRRVLGEYRLTIGDVRAHRQFDDGICTPTFWVDIHESDGTGQHAQDEDAIAVRYQIPYRCLVPLKVENLLTAGRCISGDHMAHASYRVTGDCVAMGQAAGTAAALCLDGGTTPRALDGRRVVAAMERDGAICRA
jgi:hypothetical protein